jgi:hypothetical protein
MCAPAPAMGGEPNLMLGPGKPLKNLPITLSSDRRQDCFRVADDPDLSLRQTASKATRRLHISPRSSCEEKKFALHLPIEDREVWSHSNLIQDDLLAATKFSHPTGFVEIELCPRRFNLLGVDEKISINH